MIREHVATEGSPGIAAIVTRRGRTVLAEAHGTRNVDGDPMQLDTVFPIASATKPITAAVVMSLVEDGEIGLMQRVVDYIPELPADLRDRLLVHHLLTHTGGFEAVFWTGRLRERLIHHQADDARYGRDAYVNAFLGCIPDLEVIRPPGEGMLYANLSYEMLGEIVRRVSGEAQIGDLMRSRIFDPLGMHDTAMRAPEPLRHRMVGKPPGAYDRDEMARQLVGGDFDTLLTYDSASGGLVSTVADNTTFCRMILGGGALDGVRVLSPGSVRAMTTNQIPGVPDKVFGNKEASWGYGFSVICEERWPYFGGGLIPKGSVTHTGAGGIDHWIDFENEITGAFFEILHELSPMLEPISGIVHKFQDVITAAVLD
jgi:CubicO group peptidase (beta-lactamase class C family)